MIINCLECGKAISTKQESCPYCEVINEESDIWKAKHKKKGLIGILLTPLFQKN